MRGHGSQWISCRINIRHAMQLKKSKSWEPFRSYQLNSIANPADLPHNSAKFEVNGLDWQCCLAGSSKRAPRILIFSIAMDADYSFYVKTIETHAREFVTLDVLAIGVMCSSQKLLNGIYCPCTPVSTSANALLTGYKQRFDNQSRSCNQGCSQYNSTCLYIEYRPTYPLYCYFFL